MTAKAASLIIGSSTRLETKPGASFTATGFFSSFVQSSIVRVESFVAGLQERESPPTRTIYRTGFMKCMPMKRSGREVAAASIVTEIEDVFDARMTSGPQKLVRLLQDGNFQVQALGHCLDCEIGG